jgi:voltage-gated potassium channel
MQRNLSRSVILGTALLLFWIMLGTVGFAVLEGWSFVDSLYMSIITISTVGFGEVQPLHPAGRMFASFIIVAGIGTAVYTFTGLGQLVLEGELASLLGRRKMMSELVKLKDHYVLCGFGRVGAMVAEGLRHKGVPMCVVDKDESLEAVLGEQGYVYYIGDSTDEDILLNAGIKRARALLALLPSDADNVYLAITARELNPRVQIIARASDEKAEVRLKRSGADKVVAPYKIAGARVLQAAIQPTVLEFMELVTGQQHLALRLEELRVGETSPIRDKTIAEAEIRRTCGVIIVAVKTVASEMLFNPDPGVRITAGDTLVALGDEDSLDKLRGTCQ